MRRTLLGFSTLLLATSVAGAEPEKTISNYVREKVARCWNIPASVIDNGWIVTIRFRLDRRGAVDGKPHVVTGPQGEQGEVFVQSATRAILKCSPYPELPNLAPHSVWKEITVTFNTSQLF